MKNKKIYYHATAYENLNSILEKGILKGYDGVVYLTEKPHEAARFLALRGHKKIIAFGVKLEEDLVSESFDHSEAFFKCKAYMYPKDISCYDICEYRVFEL